jgi:hypothetical protein
MSREVEGQTSFSKLAFKAIHELLIFMMNIKMRNTHPVFDTLHTGFLSWLSNKKSLYYDPQLLQMLNKIIYQMLIKLRRELQSRSIRVVHITPASLVIDTNKRTFRSAAAYYNYVRGVFESMEVFKNITLLEPRFWKILCYQNKKKYIGLEHGGVSIC